MWIRFIVNLLNLRFKGYYPLNLKINKFTIKFGQYGYIHVSWYKDGGCRWWRMNTDFFYRIKRNVQWWWSSILFNYTFIKQVFKRPCTSHCCSLKLFDPVNGQTLLQCRAHHTCKKQGDLTSPSETMREKWRHDREISDSVIDMFLHVLILDFIHFCLEICKDMNDI